ncbi:hypothetical protein [Lewinella cohaerens]|uniref:hypothetical protein n=1 Tax=Lewinella cohaerens TaxID=70995 RepID=UPI0012EC3A6D|nr:hypothetical protein [Lewinella cohaerens]
MIDIDSGLELEHNDPDLLMYKDTFVDLSNSNSVNLSKHFDGLLLLQNVSTPEK